MATVKLSIALKNLDQENDDHWTADGLPLVSYVSGLVGREVTRQEIIDAAPGLTREGDRHGEKEDFKEEVEKEEKVRLLDKKVAELQQQQKLIDREINLLKVERAKLMCTYKEYNHHLDQKRRMLHIKSQNEQRESRHQERINTLRGIDPKVLQTQAPIDAAFKRRNTRGTKRPVLPLKKD